MSAAALGPVLPAALATLLSWRAQFWLDVLLAAAIATAASRILTTAPRGTRRTHPLRRDLLLTVVGLVAATGLFFVVIDGPRLGWGSAPVITALIAAVILLALLLTVELRRRHPLLPLRLLRSRRCAAGNIVRALTEFASLGVFFPLSGYLQDELGHSPLLAGLLLMPLILGALFTAPVAEKYGGRVHAAWFLVPGLLCTAAGVYWLAHIAPDTPWWLVVIPLAVAGAGIGAVESPTDLVVRDATPRDAVDAGWRLSRIASLWGIGAGVAAVSAVWRSTGTHTAEGVNSALLLCAVAAVVATAVAATLAVGGGSDARRETRDPAPSPRTPEQPEAP